MTPAPAPGLSSFAEVDPYALGPTAIPLHAPPPRLPEGIVACGGRLEAAEHRSFAMPAFAEDLLTLHLRPLKRLSVKLDRWFHVNSVSGDLTLIPRGTPTTWCGGGTAESLLLSLPPTLTRKAALQDTDYDPTFLEFLPRIGYADPLVHAIGQAV